MPRTVQFVTDSTGCHWLPRPSSWIRGYLTHKWFEHRVGPARQASPDYFKDLAKRYGLRVIIEEDNGDISITPPPSQSRSLP